MTYEIDFSSKPKKIIKKLQKDFSLKVLEKFEQLREDPFRYLKHYEGDKCYKLRIGKYRALITSANYEPFYLDFYIIK